MKKGFLPLLLTGILSVMALAAHGQTAASQSPQQDSSNPLYRITVVARTTKAINYRHSSGPTKIDFRGTVLQPLAEGQAQVENKNGAVRIQAKFKKLAPAHQFGAEYLTYTLWAISPEGRARNLGEIQLKGGKGKLETSTELQAFALIVSAEPYFAVMQPSDVVVMENAVRPDTVGNVEEIEAKFELLQRGQYSSISINSQPSEMDPHVPLDLYEARNAVQIARAAGADRYAAESFHKAEQLLEQAETSQSHKEGKKQVEMTARESAQTAEDARAIAVKRQEDERLAQERQAAAEREARAQAEAEAAERAKLEAQGDAERAARDKAEAETARAAAQAQQQVAQDAAQRARQDAERAARDKAEAEAAADKAREQQAQAEAEKAELRAKLMNQLNQVLQTRDTVRGLIVNMSDVLFDTASSTLRPAAREKLAKISGIVLAHPGLKLQVEGHTDSVGGEEYNQRLSDQRAASVREYLVAQGVLGEAVTARGFGKLQPVASNDTPAGRQQNRRVELVVTGEAIGNVPAASATPRH